MQAEVLPVDESGRDLGGDGAEAQLQGRAVRDERRGQFSDAFLYWGSCGRSRLRGAGRERLDEQVGPVQVEAGAVVRRCRRRVGGYLVEQATPGYDAQVITGKASVRGVLQADIQLRDVRIR